MNIISEFGLHELVRKFSPREEDGFCLIFRGDDTEVLLRGQGGNASITKVGDDLHFLVTTGSPAVFVKWACGFFVETKNNIDKANGTTTHTHMTEAALQAIAKVIPEGKHLAFLCDVDSFVRNVRTEPLMRHFIRSASLNADARLIQIGIEYEFTEGQAVIRVTASRDNKPVVLLNFPSWGEPVMALPSPVLTDFNIVEAEKVFGFFFELRKTYDAILTDAVMAGK